MFIYDPEEQLLVDSYSWYITSEGYVASTSEGKTILFHKLLMPEDKLVDHKNRNKLDNRKVNLRYCTSFESAWNKNPYKKYKGVSKHVRGKWRARITYMFITTDIGYFDTEEAAALAYNEAAKKKFGDFAVLNEVII